MTYNYSDNDLDNRLFNEILHKANPDKKVLLELIRLGANINAVDKTEESLLSCAVVEVSFGLDISIIQFLIDLGADVNYTMDGFNCLFESTINCNVEVMKILLKSGADPNCVSTEGPPESILDWTEAKQWIEETMGSENAKPLAEMILLLKSYGAKNLSEIKG